MDCTPLFGIDGCLALLVQRDLPDLPLHRETLFQHARFEHEAHTFRTPKLRCPAQHRAADTPAF